MMRAGLPIVISAPSGGGKTTICRGLMQKMSKLAFSVSHTTRAPRGHEVNGVDYHFVTDAVFSNMITQDDFLEWAPVYDFKYGTSKNQVGEQFAQGFDVLFDIDIQGGKQIQQKLPHALLIFIVPPSLTILEERLRSRGTDAEAVIVKRLAAARSEIEQATFYTHWILNDTLEQAIDDLYAIIHAERLRWLDKNELMQKVLRG